MFFYKNIFLSFFIFFYGGLRAWLKGRQSYLSFRRIIVSSNPSFFYQQHSKCFFFFYRFARLSSQNFRLSAAKRPPSRRQRGAAFFKKNNYLLLRRLLKLSLYCTTSHMYSDVLTANIKSKIISFNIILSPFNSRDYSLLLQYLDNSSSI